MAAVPGVDLAAASPPLSSPPICITTGIVRDVTTMRLNHRFQPVGWFETASWQGPVAALDVVDRYGGSLLGGRPAAVCRQGVGSTRLILDGNRQSLSAAWIGTCVVVAEELLGYWSALASPKSGITTVDGSLKQLVPAAPGACGPGIP